MRETVVHTGAAVKSRGSSVSACGKCNGKCKNINQADEKRSEEDEELLGYRKTDTVLVLMYSSILHIY